MIGAFWEMAIHDLYELIYVQHLPFANRLSPAFSSR